MPVYAKEVDTKDARFSGRQIEIIAPIGASNRIPAYCDWKPYDLGSGQCLECGFEYYTWGG